MSVITFFGREFTGSRRLAERAADALGYRVLYDRDLIDAAAREYDLDAGEIRKSVYKDPPLADRFTPGKARCIAGIKSVLAKEVERGQVIFSGFLGELVPLQLGLHILVTASDSFRLTRLKKAMGQGNAADQLRQADESFLRWSLYLKAAEGRRPMDHDGVVNVSRTGQSELIELIAKAAAGKEETMSPEEFLLAAKVSRLMAEKGHPVAVEARKNQVDLTVYKPVLMLSRYGKKLSALAQSVNGVQKVKTRAGRLFYRADIYRRCEFNPAGKASYKPLELQYEQLYAQVADPARAFSQQSVRNIRVLARTGQA